MSAMGFYNKKTRLIFQVLPLFLLVDLLFLTTIPSKISHYVEYSNQHQVLKQKTAFDLYTILTERLYYLTGNSEKDFFNDIEASFTKASNFWDFKSVIARNFNILLPVICIGVLTFYLGYVVRKKKQQISIMAISIGGHAPPF